MADLEDMRLQRMGLVQFPDTDNDEAVGEEDFNTRVELYGKLKKSELRGGPIQKTN